jgi:hypothetical protein
LYFKVHKEGKWVGDSSFELECADGLDSTIYLDIASDPWQLSGYYVEISDQLYSRIRYDLQTAYFLYYVDGEWLIGPVPDVKSGVAFTRSSAQRPHLLASQEWNVHFNNKWTSFAAKVIGVNPHTHVSLPEQLRTIRNTSLLPASNSKSFSLRNGLAIPAVGLGMGGLPSQSILNILHTSVDKGYRMFDSAREYGNEWALRELLASQSPVRAKALTREEFFFISKVWPTFLGFTPTSSELLVSLAQLKSSYMNLYFLHWAS